MNGPYGENKNGDPFDWSKFIPEYLKKMAANPDMVKEAAQAFAQGFTFAHSDTTPPEFDTWGRKDPRSKPRNIHRDTPAYFPEKLLKILRKAQYVALYHEQPPEVQATMIGISFEPWSVTLKKHNIDIPCPSPSSSGPSGSSKPADSFKFAQGIPFAWVKPVA